MYSKMICFEDFNKKIAPTRKKNIRHKVLAFFLLYDLLC